MLRTRRLLVIVMSVGLMTGCTRGPSETSDRPTQPFTSNADKQDRPSPEEAPSIGIPLDVVGYLNEPCNILSALQVQDFLGSNVDREQDINAPAGPDCGWYSNESSASIGVLFPQLDDLGLTSLYRNKDKNAFFTEMPPANGYPAVAYGMSDNRDKGECTIRVGTSNESTVDITLILSDDRVGRLDPCEAAHEVATAVIGNIKARN